ncbi:VWA domain-containing protein [Acidithiobacillus sp. MC6.1]|nr:VWA domain-containing protein [Acidithiobacillus sp. MC6.1]
MSALTEKILEHLAAVSFVAGRDARAALPAVMPLGAAAELHFLETGRDLFFYDREAGKAFFHATADLVAAFGGLDPWLEQSRIFLSQRGTFRAAVGFFEQASTVRCELGIEAERTWFETGAHWLALHTDSATAYFSEPVATLLGKNSVLELKALLSPAEPLLKSRLSLGTYLQGALKVRATCGVQNVALWAQRGADILAAGRARGEAWFRMESEEAHVFLMEILPGFHLSKHKRSFALLLQAWTGLEMTLEESYRSMDAERAFVKTDGHRILVPPVMADREDALLAIYHMGAHLAFGSYEEDFLYALFRDQGLGPQWLDTDQRIAWGSLVAHFGEDSSRFQMIFDLCEDLRVDAALNREMPHYVARIVCAAAAHAQPEGPARAYYREGVAMLESYRQGTLGEDFLLLSQPGSNISDSFCVALDWYRKKDLPPLSPAEKSLAYLPGRSPNTDPAIYPTHYGCLGRDDRMQPGNMLKTITSTGITHEPPEKLEYNEIPQSDQTNESLRTTRRPRLHPSSSLRAKKRIGSPPARGGAGTAGGVPLPVQVDAVRTHRQDPRGGIPYPEWDYRINGYKKEWTRVYERRLHDENATLATEINATYKGTLWRLERALQALKPTRMVPLRRQGQGNDVDLDAAVQFIVERRAGHAPKPRIYTSRRPQLRDTAVFLLADLSTSIMAQIGGSDLRILDRLRAALLLFCEALTEVGDSFAIYGFASKYRDEVLLYPIKRFIEPFDGKTRALIGGLTGRLATRMGAAIRHSTRLFQESPAQRKLLLIVTDGRPADYDDGGDIRYLQEDTRMAAKEAQRQGVHAFCISIDPSGGEYLPAIFGSGHYSILSNINRLPQSVPEIYLRLRGK